MIEVRMTERFERWLKKLKDRQARAHIQIRLRRATLGNFGDVKSVGGGVFEMRLQHGPGYRLYYVWRGKAVIVLLVGGDKSMQEMDIRQAIELSKHI